MPNLGSKLAKLVPLRAI